MTFDTDMAKAELYRQIDLANSVLTDAERSVRNQRRRLFAELNNSGNADGAFAALQSLSASPGSLDEATFQTNLAAVKTAMATLVTDAASPTQAHVTTLNTAYTTTLKGAATDWKYRKYTVADEASLASAIATLVADAATPTQAHVNTANSALTTLLTSLC